MLYEVREYRVIPGRMETLIGRFRESALPLFRRHGMQLVFIGKTEFGDDSSHELVYVLQFDSYAEMQERWKAFMADPEWIEARKRTEINGPLTAAVRRRLINDELFLAGAVG